MGAAKAAIASGRPPRRGTWIEIFFPKTVDRLRLVVPRVGGRGLKFGIRNYNAIGNGRPPRRGTWIEM